MTRILTTVALLFATPAFGENRACNFSLVEAKEIERIKDQVNGRACDVIEINVRPTTSWTSAASSLCDFEKEIIFNEREGFYEGQLERHVDFACVPNKSPQPAWKAWGRAAVNWLNSLVQ